jgi:ketosteroid isomerase-like protein
MRKIFVTLLAAVLLSSVTLAQTAKGQEKNTGKEAQQVTTLVNQGREAAVKGDAEFLERNLADDCININALGARMTKQEAIQARKAGKVKFQSIEPREQQVHVHGNTAIAEGTYSIKGTREGQDISGEYRTTQVWVKEGGNWKQVAFQSTPVRTTASASNK